MNKISFSILIMLSATNLSISQNVGIGTNTPTEKLDVNGGIKIGNTNNTAKGTIRWNESKNDFEGYNGTAWVSLTGGKGNWNSANDYAYESYASQFLLAPNSSGTSRGKYLGNSLALINNYLLAGAPGDYDISGGVQDAGSVRIMKKENGLWKLHYILRAPGTAARTQFGHSVASDGNQFIVGANASTVGSNLYQGRAYIYGLNPDGTTTIQATLTASNGTANSYFGSSVDISGNYAIVGAPDFNAGSVSNRGIAYIFQKSIFNAAWGQQSILNPPDGGETDGIFGDKVSISGSTAVVASKFASVNNGSLDRAGKVFVYRLLNNVWTHTQTITASDAQSFDRFGSSITLKEDTLIIGASQVNDYQQIKNGKVYVYINTNDSFELQTIISAPEGTDDDAFGSSVHLENGYLIVGADNANVGAKESSGKAYIFKKNGNDWEHQAILTASNGNDNDHFGFSVVIGNVGAVVGSVHNSYQNNLLHGRLYFFQE
jgi:hypothetical protein